MQEMAAQGNITLEQAAMDVLRTEKPMRITIYLRTKSPLYSNTYEEVIKRTCSTLGIPHERSCFIATQKWPKLTALIFDVFYDDYDASTGHLIVNLPVLLVDYGRSFSHAKVASPEFQKFINKHVATQHNCHGWNAKPPYHEDQTSQEPRIYYNPRDTSLL